MRQSSFISAMLLADERVETLWSGLIICYIGLHPGVVPHNVIWTEVTPVFQSLVDHEFLVQCLFVEVGRVKERL